MLHAAAKWLGQRTCSTAGRRLPGQRGSRSTWTWTLEQASRAINYAMQISTQCSIAFPMAFPCDSCSPCPVSPHPCCSVCSACNACSSAANEWGCSVVICRRFVAAAGAIRTSMRVGSSETDPNLPERALACSLSCPAKKADTNTATAALSAKSFSFCCCCCCCCFWFLGPLFNVLDCVAFFVAINLPTRAAEIDEIDFH